MIVLSDDEMATLHDAIATHGKENQMEQLKEEMFELGLALCHFAKKKTDIKSVQTEIADVTIMCYQAGIMFGENEVDAEIIYKIARLKQRLKEHKEKNEQRN